MQDHAQQGNHLNSKCQNGYLEIILGSMFSGKTSKLIDIYSKYSICDIPTLVINYSEDTRYTADRTRMVSHDGKTINCTHCIKLDDIVQNHQSFLSPEKKGAILINEGQFFPDLYSVVNDFVHLYNKHVYVCGLDGDFKREKFGQILDLIPLCDTVYKQTALCSTCKNGTAAIFSHKHTHTVQTDTSTQKEIGAKDLYMPLCRSCYVQSTLLLNTS